MKIEIKKLTISLLLLLLLFTLQGISEANFAGTIGTRVTMTDSGFGTKKPKVYVEYEKRPGIMKKVYAKVETWSDTSITCLWTKPLSSGTYNLWVKPNVAKTNPISEGAFIIMPPSIDDVSPHTLTPGAAITINGEFFTNKKPKVYLLDRVSLRKKSCRVVNSTMDQSTGASSLNFIMPKWGSGNYEIILQTLVGEASINPNDNEPNVSLQITSGDLQIFSNEGDALPIRIDGTWSATNLGENSVFIRAQDRDNSTISPITLNATDSQSFRIDTFTNYALTKGEYVSNISFVACKDMDCNNIYANTAFDLNIQLSVEKVPEWQTHQANAFHNGYVPIWVNTGNFQRLWEWSRGPSSEPIGGINAPVAGNGEVYVSTDVYFGDAAVIALDELTGKENWRVSFGTMPALNPPAINNDTLFVATSGHEATKVWGINRADGKLKFQANFSSQWGHYLAPTIDNGLVYQTGGYCGGETYVFSAENGAEMWSNSSGASWGMDTPAIDSERVYVYSGNALTAINKTSGQTEYTIPDPFGNSDYDYHGSPVVGAQNNVLAFSGGAFSGRASSNVEHYDNRVISSFDSLNGEYRWATDFAYKTFFAVSNGVIYAGKNNPVALDAIDESTGDVLWSWVAPTTQDKEFHRNVIVTKNLLFVSTNANLYAIDLETKESVWSYNEPGMIAISDNRILLLAPGHRESDGRLIAFDLRSK